MSQLCCVCDNFAKRGSRFCADCKIIYSSVNKEPWFEELCNLMKRQRKIDDIEKYSIYDSNTKSLQSKYQRRRGRPTTSKVVRELVLSLKETSPDASIRDIESSCVSAGVIVSRETIRRILTQK